MIGHWLWVAFGIGGSGPVYGFWSGFGSDIAELSIVVALWHMVNCHEKGCYRLGHHFKGHVVCHKHRSNIDALRNQASNG